MKKVTVTINCGNAAFEDDPYDEVARILRSIADRFLLADALGTHAVLDLNGNTVGSWSAR